MCCFVFLEGSLMRGLAAVLGMPTLSKAVTRSRRVMPNVIAAAVFDPLERNSRKNSTAA